MTKKIFFVITFFLSVGCLSPSIRFSHQVSQFKLNSGSKLILDQAISNWDGTLLMQTGSDIIGQDISFMHGILDTYLSQGLLTADFSPDVPDKIFLNGNSKFIGSPGTVAQSIEVSGKNNRLEGQSLFDSTIIFDGDFNTTLTVALQSKLNKSIELNTGTLILNDDLHLGDDSLITGSGTIVLNNNTLHLPGAPSTWSSVFDFKDALELELHAKVSLTSSWTFNGDAGINGNGNILDMSHHLAKIYVAPNTILSLSSLYLKGIEAQKLDFADETSMVRMTNVQVELANNVQTLTGGIYVEGTTTFILRDHDWLFDTNGSLTVDGATLWLDTNESNPGELKAPKAIFVDHVWQDANVRYNEAARNLTFVNTGTVKELCDRSTIIVCTSETCTKLTKAPLTSDLTLENSCFIHPTKFIQIDENLTIDGQGATLFFADPDKPQFIVSAGKTVILKNLTLTRLNNNTFDQRVRRQPDKTMKGGNINIDEDVIFELSNNITFSQSKISLTNNSAQTANVFFVRGLGGQKRLSISKNPEISGDLLNLGHNTMTLQDIELEGVENISHSVDQYFAGAIGLNGDAIVNVGDPDFVLCEFQRRGGSKEDCNKIFVVEGENNKLLLQKNDLSFSGQIIYSDFGDNYLHFDFSLTNRLGNDLIESVPVVNFKDNFIKLKSDSGLARLVFDYAKMRVNNTINAFYVYQNSYLQAKHLIVSGAPIINAYDPATNGAPFKLEANQLTSYGIDSPIACQDITRACLGEDKKYRTALDLMQELYPRTNQTNNNMLRSFSSGQKVCKYENINRLTLGNASGNILLNGTNIEDFYVDSSGSLDLLFDSNSTLALKNQKVELKGGDKISVVGKNNTIKIANEFVVNGKFDFTAGSELMIEFDERFDDPKVIFNATYNDYLTLKAGCRLEFKGYGTASFSDGYKIKLEQDTDNKAGLIFSDSSLFTINGNGDVLIMGQGDWTIDKGAQVDIASNQHLIIGSSTDDDINIRVDRSGVLKVINSLEFYNSLDVTAKISIQQTRCSLDFEQGALLYVGKGGIFEINALNNVEQKGILTDFRFDTNGIFNVDTGGTLIIGANRNSGLPRTEHAFNWDNQAGQVSGNGIIKLVATGFAGQLQNVILGPTQLTSESFVKNFIETVSDLSVSTVFTDENNQSKVRMKNGVIYDLLSDDVIESDDAITGYVYGINDEVPFVMYLDGTRS